MSKPEKTMVRGVKGLLKKARAQILDVNNWTTGRLKRRRQASDEGYAFCAMGALMYNDPDKKFTNAAEDALNSAAGVVDQWSSSIIGLNDGGYGSRISRHARVIKAYDEAIKRA